MGNTVKELSLEKALQKLEEIGIDSIINQISSGMRLHSTSSASKPGILNNLNINQEHFKVWINAHDPADQYRFQEAMALASINLTSDVIHFAVDAIEEIDALYHKKTERGATQSDLWKLQLQEAKHERATKTLAQLIAIQKIRAENNKPADMNNASIIQPKASVHMTDEQKKRLASLKKETDTDY